MRYLKRLLKISPFALLAPISVQAQEAVERLKKVGVGIGQSSEVDLRVIIANIINAALGLLGIIFVALIIFGGYNYLIAGGNEERITKAKKTIYRAFVGLLIIIAAYAITAFVVSSLVKATR